MNYRIKHLYINPNVVHHDASSFSPLLPLPSIFLSRLSICSLTPWAESRQNATCAGWQDSPRPRRLMPPLLLFLHLLLLLLLLLTAAELPGHWKINLQHRWVTQEHVHQCKYGFGCEWMGRFKRWSGDRVWKDPETRSRSVHRPCWAMFLETRRYADSRFLISSLLLRQILARLSLCRCWLSKCVSRFCNFRCRRRDFPSIHKCKYTEYPKVFGKAITHGQRIDSIRKSNHPRTEDWQQNSLLLQHICSKQPASVRQH